MTIVFNKVRLCHISWVDDMMIWQRKQARKAHVIIEEICKHDLDLGKQGNGGLAGYLGIDICQLEDGSTEMTKYGIIQQIIKECSYRMQTLSTPLLGNC